MKYHIKNGRVLILENETLNVVEKDLFVADGRIVPAPAAEELAAYEVIDANNKLIMPGLVNMHTHAYMTVMRNYADDVDFDEWLFKRCMPVEDRLPQEGAYWSSLLAIEEMIRTGTTCFNDMHMFKGQSARAARDAGMRGIIGRGLVGGDLMTDGMVRRPHDRRDGPLSADAGRAGGK